MNNILSITSRVIILIVLVFFIYFLYKIVYRREKITKSLEIIGLTISYLFVIIGMMGMGFVVYQINKNVEISRIAFVILSTIAVWISAYKMFFWSKHGFKEGFRNKR
mgnify:CR=1 FL=1